MDNLLGKQIAHYRIEAVLGEGGMGVVYRATDLNLARPVALKIMHRQLARQPEFQQRFMQEAQAAARLSHPCIVTVYNFDHRGDLYYIVMEYVPGQGLGTYLDRLNERGLVIELNETLFLIAQVADALGYAHDKGIVHRDIKPDNILLMRLRQPERPGEPAFRVKVTDFGLAKLLEGGMQTATGTFMGTLPYMSPEQTLGKPLDGRSDIYSLGVMLYQLATGRLPFDIKTPTEAVIKHMQETPPPPLEVRPGLPQSVAAIIGRAIAKRPEDRYQTAEEMAMALRRAMAGTSDDDATYFAAPESIVSLATQVQVRSESAPPPTIEIYPPGMVDQLYATSNNRGTQTFSLDRPALTIGRAATNDIVLVGDGVSRQHVRLERGNTGWDVTDLGSTNGTFLNGRQLPANRRFPWNPEQPLDVGEFRLTWQPAVTMRAAVPPVPSAYPTSATVAPTHRESQMRPFVQFSMGLQPDELEQEGITRVSIRNTGSAAGTFTVTGRDRQQRLQFDPPVTTLLVGPGQTSTVDLHVSAREKPLFGNKRNLPFEVEVTSDAAPMQTLPGRLVVRPAFPGWAATMLGLILVLCCLGTGLIYAFTQQEQRNQEATRLAAALTATAAAAPVDTPEDPTAAAATATTEAATAEAATIIALTAEAELTPSVTPTPSETPTETPTGEPTATETPTPSITPSQTATATEEPPTATPTPTETPTETPTPTVAATPIGGGGGVLTFASDRGGVFQIYRMNLDGSEQESLTDSGDVDWTPVWSPDGSRIAFLSNRDGNNEIYVMDADGSNQVNLTNNPAADFEPAWSPDGSRIAFASDRDGNIEIYVMNANGGNVTRLTDDPSTDFSPTWSPDGSRIAFVSGRDGNTEIYVMDADGSNLIRLTNNAASDFDPDWSPDGTRIVFVSNRDGNEEIYVMTATGTAQTRLTNSPGRDRNPRWSPDSFWVAFQSNRDGDEEIFIMRADGAAVTQVTNNSVDDIHPAWLPVPQ